MSTEKPETPDEVRRVIREAAAEVSRRYHQRYLDVGSNDVREPIFQVMAEAFEAFEQELER